MSQNLHVGSSFDLNYLFTDSKGVFNAFENLERIHRVFFEFDKKILITIDASLKVEYRLGSVEYGSLKSQIIQIISSLPASWATSVIGDIDSLLIAAKYWIAKAISKGNIDDAKQIQEIQGRIVKKLGEISQTGRIISDISPYSILETTHDAINAVNTLKPKESYEFKSRIGNAVMKFGTQINKSKILSELGETNGESETKEIVLPKRIDLLSDKTRWEFKLNGKIHPMKILDKNWLQRYHNQEVTIGSGDSLYVVLKTNYSTNKENHATKASYEIKEILDVIKAQPVNQISI